MWSSSRGDRVQKLKLFLLFERLEYSAILFCLRPCTASNRDESRKPLHFLLLVTISLTLLTLQQHKIFNFYIYYADVSLIDLYPKYENLMERHELFKASSSHLCAIKKQCHLMFSLKIRRTDRWNNLLCFLMKKLIILNILL